MVVSSLHTKPIDRANKTHRHTLIIHIGRERERETDRQTRQTDRDTGRETDRERAWVHSLLYERSTISRTHVYAHKVCR